MATTNASDNTDDAGRVVLGRYRLVRELGRSRSTVYEAIDPRLGRRVAVKEHRAPEDADDESATRSHQGFLWEGIAAASLDHPNIVSVLDAGTENDRSYLVMELLEGQSLAEVLNTRGRLPVDEALGIVAPILDALQFASDRGVIHRDIKPANLLLLGDGTVKIADFGIAKLESDGRALRKRGLAGTPSYMSPEQAGKRPIDCRSDLFSAGVVLYEMVTGERPFRGETTGEILKSIEYEEVRFGEDLPPELCNILSRALQRDPRARYASAEDMLAAIRELQHQRSYGAPAGNADEGPEEPLPASAELREQDQKASSRRRVALGVAIAALLGWLAALVMRWAGGG